MVAATTDRGGLRLLVLAHIVNDLNQSAIPAIIPFLVLQRHMSLAAAGTLTLAMNLSSSIVQPLFGHWSDKRSLAWVIPAALVFAGVGTACIGIAPHYWLALLAALVAGIGVAAFHPEGSRYANYFSGTRRAVGMGWFTLGGYAGFALGPLLITPLLLAFGLPGTAYIAIPGVLLAIFFTFALGRFERARNAVHGSNATRMYRDDWPAFRLLSLTVALRSTAFLAAVTFLPIFALRQLHTSTSIANMLLSAMLFAGGAGTILGGRLGEHHDRRKLVTISMLAAAIVALAIVLFGSISAWLLLALAIAYGMSLGLSASTVVVLGQEYLPGRIGVASGVTLGLAVTIGGLLAPVFGHIGDTFGTRAIFATIVACAALTTVVSMTLRRPLVQIGKPEEREC
ncbi:MAG: MFS transporter [Vulcanimicrobiaceae bacterium]